MQVVVNLQLFNERFRSGLVFSLLEGLSEGCGVTFLSEEPLDETKRQIQQSQLEGLGQIEYGKENGLWSLAISKASKKESHGCCGVCGMHDQSRSEVG